jgi:hypothetical protein
MKYCDPDSTAQWPDCSLAQFCGILLVKGPALPAPSTLT